MNMEDDDRQKLFKGLSQQQIEDVATFANQYPSVSLDFHVNDEENILAGEDVVVTFTVEREGDQQDLKQIAHAPYYPKVKEELWWIMIGEKE